MDAVTLRPGLSFVRTEYGGVILDMRQGSYWRLNPVGAEVVASLLPKSDADPVAAVLGRFEVDEATAQRDVGELLGHLREIGLVLA
ncbi:lasso peptide biosynthesis PqqD family chaperone [Nocardia wallacei]|uniref:lasso peptide biosynthesis PqqD family chaperone n=1 Tax=Nocardia wallacei TaxID=480035 RepID=UPI002454A119|nr:lasso peptide biosynthesis PqqD family chaperone [Nocardia wallacei]